MVVEATFLLFALNEHLARTALLVQPLHLGAQAEGTPPEAGLDFVDIPLPLAPGREARIGGISALRWGQAAPCASHPSWSAGGSSPCEGC